MLARQSKSRRIQHFATQHVDLDEQEKFNAKSSIDLPLQPIGQQLVDIVENQLPNYFDRQSIIEHIKKFPGMTHDFPNCLSAWRILFQQLQIISLFTHTLLENPLEFDFENSAVFNKTGMIARQILKIGARITFAENKNYSYSIDFSQSEHSHYELATIEFYVDLNKLVMSVVKTISPSAAIGDGIPLAHCPIELEKFVDQAVLGLQSIRMGLVLIENQLLFVDTSRIAKPVAKIEQAFTFFCQCVIADSDIYHFLKTDLILAKTKLFHSDKPLTRREASDFFQEIFTCIVFIYQALYIELAKNNGIAQQLAKMPNSITEAFPIQFNSKEDIYQYVHPNSAMSGDKQQKSVQTYFDYAYYRSTLATIAKMTPEDNLQFTHQLFVQNKNSMSCLMFIMKQLHADENIYQHVELDTAYKNALYDSAPPHHLELNKTEKNTAQRILMNVLTSELLELQTRIDALDVKKTEFYAIFNPLAGDKNVKDNKKRQPKIIQLRTANNSLNIQLNDIRNDYHALKTKPYTTASQKEYESVIALVITAEQLATKNISAITTLCQQWGIAKHSTTQIPKMKRRHSDNAAKTEKKHATKRHPSHSPRHTSTNSTPLITPAADTDGANFPCFTSINIADHTTIEIKLEAFTRSDSLEIQPPTFHASPSGEPTDDHSKATSMTENVLANTSQTNVTSPDNIAYVQPDTFNSPRQVQESSLPPAPQQLFQMAVNLTPASSLALRSPADDIAYQLFQQKIETDEIVTGFPKTSPTYSVGYGIFSRKNVIIQPHPEDYSLFITQQSPGSKQTPPR